MNRGKEQSFDEHVQFVAQLVSKCVVKPPTAEEAAMELMQYTTFLSAGKIKQRVDQSTNLFIRDYLPLLLGLDDNLDIEITDVDESELPFIFNKQEIKIIKNLLSATDQ